MKPIALAMASAVLTLPAAAETVIAVVDYDAVLANLPLALPDRGAVEAEFASEADQIARMEDEVAELERLVSDAINAGAPPARIAAAEKALADADVQLAEAIATFEQKVAERLMALERAADQAVISAVEDERQARGVDLVIDSAVVLAVGEMQDLTAGTIERVREN